MLDTDCVMGKSVGRTMTSERFCKPGETGIHSNAKRTIKRKLATIEADMRVAKTLQKSFTETSGPEKERTI